jgi:hypothetical protein
VGCVVPVGAGVAPLVGVTTALGAGVAAEPGVADAGADGDAAGEPQPVKISTMTASARRFATSPS